jgi:hypothetical protein
MTAGDRHSYARQVAIGVRNSAETGERHLQRIAPAGGDQLATSKCRRDPGFAFRLRWAGFIAKGRTHAY